MNPIKNPNSNTKSGIKVLLIDDDELTLMQLSGILKAEKYSVFAAKNYEEAVSYIRTNKFDFIIVDIRLPDKDGFAVALEFRKSNPTAKIIAISALWYEQPGYISRARSMGLNGIIAKPIEKDALLEQIKNLDIAS